MAKRIPRDESLSRVHGTGSLFAAAYGNVGSSIYYALGVVALYALGLTPVTAVFGGLVAFEEGTPFSEETMATRSSSPGLAAARFT